MTTSPALIIDGHIQWLAEQARMFGQAQTPEQLRDACLTTPRTGLAADVDPGTEDGYHAIVNAAAGQMQAICDALANAILGPVQS